MRSFFFTFLSLFSFSIFACGGGGGGGGGAPGGGDTSSGGGTSSGSGGGSSGGGGGGTNFGTGQGYPLLTPDPLRFGDKMTRSGNTFTITSRNDKTLTFSATNRTGYVLNFPSNMIYSNVSFDAVGMTNEDAVLVATHLDNKGAFPDPYLFSLNGNWSKNISSRQTTYYGQYKSINSSGNSNGVFPIAINVDYDNINRSSGVDLVNGETIYVQFSTIEGHSITGTISDQNDNYNSASFGAFGNNARTIAGGYANTLGAGTLLVVEQGR